jgi:hypothetical protein
MQLMESGKYSCRFTSSDTSEVKPSATTSRDNTSIRSSCGEQRSNRARSSDDNEGVNILESHTHYEGDTLRQNEGGLSQKEGDPFQHEGGSEREEEASGLVQPELTPAPIRWSTRTWKPTQSYLESVQQEDLVLSCIPCCMEALNYSSEEEEITKFLISLMAQADNDTMYWDQAMKEPDAQRLLEAALIEIQTHEDNKHWGVVPIEDLCGV